MTHTRHYGPQKVTHNVQFKEGMVQILILYQIVAPNKADPILDMLAQDFIEIMKINENSKVCLGISNEFLRRNG